MGMDAAISARVSSSSRRVTAAPMPIKSAFIHLLWRSEDDNSTLRGRSPLTEEESATRRTRRRRLVVY
jgi:hypothetical protein